MTWNPRFLDLGVRMPGGVFEADQVLERMATAVAALEEEHPPILFRNSGLSVVVDHHRSHVGGTPSLAVRVPARVVAHLDPTAEPRAVMRAAYDAMARAFAVEEAWDDSWRPVRDACRTLAGHVHSLVALKRGETRRSVSVWIAAPSPFGPGILEVDDVVVELPDALTAAYGLPTCWRIDRGTDLGDLSLRLGECRSMSFMTEMPSTTDVLRAAGTPGLEETVDLVAPFLTVDADENEMEEARRTIRAMKHPSGTEEP